MYYVAITCLLALSASVNADGALGLGGLGGLGDLGGLGGLVYAPGHASADYYAYPRYAFEYAVKDPHTGDNKAQWEKRDGDTVKGSYSLVEPDGSLRVVEYWADDKSGFNAVVKRIGPNVHPTSVNAAPIYKAPIPVLASESIAPIAPISIGPVAKLGGLAGAPLISGPILAGAVSSSNLYKPISVPTLKPLGPELPILSAPIIKQAPLYTAPYLPAPILKSAPLLSNPIYSNSYLKSGPILSSPILPAPILKSAPILTGPISSSYLSGSLPLSKGIDYSLGGLGEGWLKGPIGGSLLSDLGQGLISKGYSLDGLGGIGGLSDLSYSLYDKH